MNMMRRFAVLFAWSLAAFSQAPTDLFSRAPKEVDDALRERIKAFYQYHIDDKYRLAEALVAEDTKDFFYSSNKPRYLSFEIKDIIYSNDFSRAKVTTMCEQYVLIPGFADKPLKVPTPSTWKLVDGKWFWYVDTQAVRKTPFGEVKPGTGKVTLPGAAPRIPTAAEMAFIGTQVKADTERVTIKTGESGHFKVTNGAPGPMSLTVYNASPGLEVAIRPKELPAGGSAEVTVKAAKAGTVQLRVDQTNQIIAVQVLVE
jgi:hypothetical protein